MTAPETLLAAALGGPDGESLVHSVPMLLTPYDALASVPGWVIGVNDDAPSTAPFVRGLQTADDRVLAGLSVALDYAVRRGAASLSDAVRVLNRETPVWIPAFSTGVSERLRGVARELGIGGEQEPTAFARRRVAHAVSLGRRHDPAMSFQPRSADEWIGGNSRSSMELHSGATQDGFSAEGEVCERWDVQIEIDDESAHRVDLISISNEIRCMVAFLDGVSAQPHETSILAGWRRGNAPAGEQLAGVLYAWTKALFDVTRVHVLVRFEQD